MSRLIPLLALLLAACVQGPATVAAFRPAKAPIWSSAAFNMARIEGRWTRVASFAAGEAPGCQAGGAEFSRGPGGMQIAGRLCLNGREVAVSGPLRMVGPGRMAVPGMADWWVIWVDSGYRTLAVGTPDGTFGFVLDQGQIGRDRLIAASEVFEFNGYSKERLLPF